MPAIPVYLEIGEKRVFASALDWPGWTRSARDEPRALEALAAYAPRYSAVPKAARIEFASEPKSTFKVVERVHGNATTDFGAPGMPASSDAKSLTRAEAERICALLGASGKSFDAAAANTPADLRQGPRGGGR